MTDLVLGHDPHKNKIIISRKEQRRSLYVIGSSGTGKSTLLLNMVKQTMDQEIGLCLIDPHRDLTNQVIAIATPRQRERIIVIDPSDEEFCVGLNMYECPNPTSKKAVNDTVERIMHLWDKLFHITTKEFPQISEYMRQAAHTIVVNPGYTMADVYRLFRDKEFRNKLLVNVQNQSVKEFWADFERLPSYKQTDEISAVRRRLSEFMTDMVIPIVGQAKSTINMREIMDTRPGKIVLLKLDRNQESVSSLIGSMMISLIRIAAFSREDIIEDKRKHFIVYADEFSNYVSSEYQTVVSELRKYAVCSVMLAQDRHILDAEVPEMVRTTLGTNMVVFNVNTIDANVVSGRFDATPASTETRREAVLVPKRDVLNHILHQGHTSKEVTEFVSEYLQKIVAASQEPLDYTNVDEIQKDPQKPTVKHTITLFINGQKEEKPFCEYAYLPDKLKKTLSSFNELLYLYNAHTSVYKNLSGKEFMQKSKPLEEEVAKSFSGILGFYHYAKAIYEPSTNEGKQALSRLRELDNKLQELLNDFDKATEQEQDEIFKQINKTGEQRQECKQILEHGCLAIIANTLRTQEALGGRWDFKNVTQGWFSVNQDRDFLYLGNYKNLPPDGFELVVEVIYKAEEKRYQKFIDNLLPVHVRLGGNPIMTESGSHEEKPVAQQTHADKQKEIANMLSGLPNFTAYTRIGGDIQYCWNCGAKPQPNNIYCGSCSKKLKNEYTISITPPPFSPIDLKAVTNKIIQQNFRDTYLKKRSDVEKEITARQQPPAPAPQPQKPAAPTPNIPAKRKAAIGKICPKCGANNPATSLYCSQDGTKL